MFGLYDTIVYNYFDRIETILITMAKFVELLLTALQYQTEGMLTMVDFLLVSLDPREARRRFQHIPTEERYWFKKNWADMYRSRQQFYMTLHQLQRQGLVVRTGPRRKSRWFLTKLGKKRVKSYRERRQDQFSSSFTSFEKPHGKGLVVVVFDIPEKERKKRDWIRACLVGMNFKKLQKSVWVTRGRIPEDFFSALRDRDLLENVHIFSAAKHGTIVGQ